MCSVVGCDSWRRGAQRFKLPEDPERRLEWVQFLLEVNRQRLKESSCTDINICIEHFTDDCFENVIPSGTARLRSSAVPTLCIKSEPEEPEPHEGLVEITQDAFHCDQLKSPGSPSCYSEESLADQESPVPSDISDASMYDYGQMLQDVVNIDIIREKAALLQMKRKYVVNETRLLQLFSCKCPLCGSQVKVEKVTYGVLIVLNQECLECEYRNQWKSQANASVPTSEEQLMERIDVTPLIQQCPSLTVSADDDHSTTTGVSEIVSVVNEESDPMDETEDDDDDMDSDSDWNPMEKLDESGEESENDDYPNDYSSKHSELCTDCGTFFNKRKPHTCEHKIKPYSCNICGRRCVSEAALNYHSRIHDENYEHRCKYCRVTLKTKVGKQKHEQTHMNEEKPYKCTECSETFATNKECKIHLEDHTGPPQLKCHICGMEFPYPLSLQRHLTVHTGERPFKCSVCQRGFKQASHLKSHMRLHTGERPFKCQHCDKCFNHNVSLKSHIQRYHTSNSGCEQTKENINEKEHDTGDGEGNQTGANSGLDNVEKKQDTEEEMQGICRTKTNGKITGRPKGRPKTYESSNLVLAVQVEGQCSKSKTRKPKMQKSKRTQCSDEESEDDLSDSDMAFDSAQEEAERSKTVIKNMSSRGRSKKPDSDSDFDPGERNKKRYSSHNSGKSLRKRPRKNHVE